jgi:hypothetical protein
MRAFAAAVVAVLLVGPLAAQAPPDAPTLTLSGFVNASVFAQDQSFGYGNGQNAVWAMPEPVEDDNWLMGGDVRNTRLRLTLDQDMGEGFTVQAVVEADFFGAFNGTGPYSDEQPQPRLRLAYVDLDVGHTTLRVGQMFTPLMGVVPTSLSHIAFPLGLASGGVIGWRHPGILVQRQLRTGDGLKIGVQGGAFRGSWSGPGDNLDHQSAGEAGSVPQLEARLDLRQDLGGVAWSAYLVGHYDRKDLDGIGVDSLGERELEGLGVQAGGSVARGPVTFKGNAYWGRALGQQFAQLGQFGDIAGWGAWAQGQLRVSDHWDLSVFVGQDDPRDEDVVREVAGAGRLRNRTTAAMARFTIGTYALGLEALHARTVWADQAGVASEWDTSARQIILSVIYHF